MYKRLNFFMNHLFEKVGGVTLAKEAHIHAQLNELSTYIPVIFKYQYMICLVAHSGQLRICELMTKAPRIQFKIKTSI
jgi:hypothetical protein